MTLPLKQPYPPMEARSVAQLPSGADWQYEPKWDGFRCLAFRDGDRIELQSKSGQPLARYFPEVVEHLRALSARSFVLDGEIVVPVDGRLSFDDLLQRIHPAASRIARLDLPYQTGERTGMQKVKRRRTVDCVVGGFRYASGARVVGSLLLGLYDADGLLHHVGFTSGFATAERKALLTRLAPLRKPPGFTGRTPGGPSRWSTERSAEWEPLELRLVVE